MKSLYKRASIPWKKLGAARKREELQKARAKEPETVLLEWSTFGVEDSCDDGLAAPPNLSAAESCDKKEEETEKTEPEQLPQQVLRGVSIEFLFRYAIWLRKQVGLQEFHKMRTQDLVHGVGHEPHVMNGRPMYNEGPAHYSVRALTQATQSNLVDFFNSSASQWLRRELAMVDISELCGGSDEEGSQQCREKSWFGRADLFCSHPWSLKFFSEFIQAIRTPRTTNSKTMAEHLAKRVWVDVFAVNQHYLDDVVAHEQVLKEREEDLRGFKDVIKYSRAVLLFFTPWYKPILLERAWCWYEISTALKFQKPLVLALNQTNTNDLRQIAQSYCKQEGDRSKEEAENVAKCTSMLEEINVESSLCLLEEDKERILRVIEAEIGFERANQKVKLSIASVLMTTADSLLNSHHAKGASALFEAMLEHFEGHAKREKAIALNKLVRTYTIMGWRDKALFLCQEAIRVQRELLSQAKQASDESNDLALELATNLNSLGRLYSDMRHIHNNLEPALVALEEALKLRRKYKDPMVWEVLYNIGRSIVVYYEINHSEASIPASRNRMADLALAKRCLQESMKMQERNEEKLPSLGACYVFMGKAIDLIQGNDDETFEETTNLFEKGLKVQLDRYGPGDPRIYMTKLDTARHFIVREEYEVAWDLLVAAHNGLSTAVRDVGADPLKLLECACEMRIVTEKLGSNLRASQAISSALRFIDWLEASRPKYCDKPEVLELILAIRAWAVDFYDGKLALAMHHLQEAGFSAQVVQGTIPNGAKTPSPALFRLSAEDLLRRLPSGLADVILLDVAQNLQGDKLMVDARDGLQQHSEEEKEEGPKLREDLDLDGAVSDEDEIDYFEQLEESKNKISALSKALVRVLANDGVGFVFTNEEHLSFWMAALRQARMPEEPSNIAATGTSSRRRAGSQSERASCPRVYVEHVAWVKPSSSLSGEKNKSISFGPDDDAESPSILSSVSVSRFFSETKDLRVDVSPGSPRSPASSVDVGGDGSFMMMSGPSVSTVENGVDRGCKLLKERMEYVVIFRRSRTAGAVTADVLTRRFGNSSWNVWSKRGFTKADRLPESCGSSFLPIQKPLSLIRPLVEGCLQKYGQEEVGRKGLVIAPRIGAGTVPVACLEASVPCLASDTLSDLIDLTMKRCSSVQDEEGLSDKVLRYFSLRRKSTLASSNS